jgi:hypothetical protein
MCWGAGTLEAHVRGVDLDRLGLEEESDAPIVPFVCGRYQSCHSVELGTTSTRGVLKCHNARSVGEHAGVRRAPCDEDACAELGGSAAQPAPPRAVQQAVGKCRRVGRAPCRRRGDRSTRGGDDAGAHARHAAAHLRIAPVDAPSKADQPPELRLLAGACGLPHGPAHRVAHRVRRALQAFARSDTCGLGGARGSAVTLERRRRALSRGAHAARPHAPRSSGGRGSRGARARRERSKRPRRAVEAAATPGSRGPEQRGMGVRSSGRSRPSGSTRALGNARPHEGIAELASSTIGKKVLRSENVGGVQVCM